MHTLRTAFIHFDLWTKTDGYRSNPRIGPPFLVQSITGLVIGLGVVTMRRLREAMTAPGLFGFKDSWLAAFAKEASTAEILVAAVPTAAATLCLVGSVPDARARPTPAGTAS